jgi:hypothetical protein
MNERFGGEAMRARVGREEKMKAITLRLPASLHEDLTQHLQHSNRSLNYEIVARLYASIELQHVLLIKDPSERLAALDRVKRRLIDLRVPEGNDQ